jgi:DNA-directed RNA polymerase subunit RPC12/RpoP
MPQYVYKCFRCGKKFASDRLFTSVFEGSYGACPKCDTVVTKLNLIGLDDTNDRLEMFQEEMLLVTQWVRKMRTADENMSRQKSTTLALKQYVGTKELEPAINSLEEAMASSILLLLGRAPWNVRQMICRALGNEVIVGTKKDVYSNNCPLLVMRFFNGYRNGLAAACQGSIGHEDCKEDPWQPKRERGTTTKQSKDHQRGKKKQESGSHNSDVISTSCSIRNLVRCSAGRYPCTPGGQVVPIFFGADHMPEIIRNQYAKMWAPKIALILIPACSYVVDWKDYLVNETSESTSPDVSFFEREVSYDTFGGTYHLADEFIVFVGDNPFHGMIGKNTSNSTPFGGGNRFGTLGNKRLNIKF